MVMGHRPSSLKSDQLFLANREAIARTTSKEAKKDHLSKDPGSGAVGVGTSIADSSPGTIG